MLHPNTVHRCPALATHSSVLRLVSHREKLLTIFRYLALCLSSSLLGIINIILWAWYRLDCICLVLWVQVMVPDVLERLYLGLFLINDLVLAARIHSRSSWYFLKPNFDSQRIIRKPPLMFFNGVHLFVLSVKQPELTNSPLSHFWIAYDALMVKGI